MALPVAAVEGGPIAWEVPEQQVGLWSDACQRFRRNRLAVLGLGIVIFLVGVALISPLLVHFGIIHDPIKQQVESIETPPGVNGHLFGTDILGRDTLSRLMLGSQVSLTVGLLVQGIIFPIGLAIGLTAGYFGGRIDTLTFGIPNAIFLEAVLSFLGVGIRPPQPTWGQMVADGTEAIYANPTSVVFPAFAIGFTLLAFSFIGDGLRDALDPRMRR